MLPTIVEKKRFCIRSRIVRCGNVKEIVFPTEMNKKLLCTRNELDCVFLSGCSFTRSFGLDNYCYCIHKKKFTELNWC